MSVTIELLGRKDADALRALLVRDPVQNLYLLGLLEEYGVEPAAGHAPFGFHGRFEGRELTAAVFVGGHGALVVPSACVPSDITEIASRLAAGKTRMRACLGEKGAVDTLIRHLGPERPRLSRVQRLYSVSADDLGPFTNPTLRLARDDDLEPLLPMAANSVQETRNRNPLKEDPAGFRHRVAQRIKRKRTYVLESSGALVFKVDVGSRSAHGAELEGLFTVPHERRRGHATLSLGQLSRHLLSSLPRLTLRVDENDPSLAGVARKVGYHPHKTQRLVVGD